MLAQKPHTRLRYSYMEYEKIRKRCYLFVIIVGVVLIFTTPMAAHADLFSFEIPSPLLIFWLSEKLLSQNTMIPYALLLHTLTIRKIF